MARIYFDYASTTPVDPLVVEAMNPFFSEKFGNPNSLHWAGQEAQEAMDIARKQIADFFGVRFGEIIFTGSATEANNLALRGLVEVWLSKIKPIHLIVSAIEHESVLATAQDLENTNLVEVTYLRPSGEGIIEAAKVAKAVKDNTILISIIYANNEIGTIQPIKEISKALNLIKKERTSKRGLPIYFHTDAVQALNYLPVAVDLLGVDLMTFSAHKIYGPKGIGALYVKTGTPLKAQITGGGQEYNLRSGTENVPYIVGFAKALSLIKEYQKKGELAKIKKLRDSLLKALREVFPEIQVNGSLENRLPNNLNLYLPRIDSQEALLAFDLAGVAISIGSACSARARKASHVLKALGLPKERIESSLRISLGRFNNQKELDEFVKIFKEKILPLRQRVV